MWVRMCCERYYAALALRVVLKLTRGSPLARLDDLRP